MIIVQKIDSRKLKALKAYVNAYYEGNRFLKDDFDSFFLLWLLLDEHKDDWQEKLLTNLLYYKTKNWLNGLFVKESPDIEMNLTLEDIVKLVMNNITKLPGCRCKLRKLTVEAK